MADPSIPPPTRRTLHELLLIAGGRGGLLTAWFAATLVLARSLGPAGFGLFALCLTAIRVAVGCVGDPLDTAVMREAPLFLAVDRPRAIAVVRAAFWSRATIGTLAVVGTATAAALRPNHADLIALAGVGVLGDLLLRSALAYFQIARSFGRFLAVDTVWQLGRALAAVALVATGTATPTTAVLAYVLPPYAAFAVGLALLPADVRRLAPPDRRRTLEMLRYARWLAAAAAMAAGYEAVDRVLLARFRGEAAVGLYAAAAQLAAVPDFLDGFVQTVLSPRIAPAFAAGSFNALQRTYFRYAIPAVTVATAMALIVAGPFIRTFLSATYAGAVPAFRLLVCGTAFNLAVTPLASALLAYAAPRRATALTAASLAFAVAGGLLIVPRYGLIGAAALILATRVLTGGVTVVWATRLAGPRQPPVSSRGAKGAVRPSVPVDPPNGPFNHWC